MLRRTPLAVEDWFKASEDMIDYGLAAREIGWLRLADPLFDSLWSAARSACVLSLEVALPSARTLSIAFDDPAYSSLLAEKFTVSRTPNEISQPHLIYADVLESLPATQGFSDAGFISGSRDRCLVFGKSAGVLKSLVSSCAGYFFERHSHLPLHAAVMLAHETGVALVGGHGAGKTTNTLRLASSTAAIDPLCDDWSSVAVTNGALIARAEDRSVSFTPSAAAAHGLVIEPSATKPERKKSMAPEQVLVHATGVREVELGIFVGLIPCLGDNIAVKVSPDRMASHILQTAYHYPYVDQHLADLHRSLWERRLPADDCYFLPAKDREGRYNQFRLDSVGL